MALISWGDGTTSTGLVQGDGYFEVVGEHIYDRRGTYSVLVAILDTTYLSLPLGSDYNPMPPELFLKDWAFGLAAQSIEYSYFRDYYQYFGYIAFLYANAWGGYDFPRANWNGVGNNGIRYNHVAYLIGATSTVQVTNPAIEFENGSSLSATAGSELTGIILATGSTGNEKAGTSFTAIVNWGDGTQSIVAVEDDAEFDGEFNVAGNHTYASPGTYTATITLYDGVIDYHTACVITVAAVASFGNPAVANAIVATSEDLSATAGEQIDDELVATFTVENPAHIGGTHVVIIDWGDHTTSIGDVKKGNGDHEYRVYGSHTYDVPGKYIIHISIQDQTDSTTASGIVIVTGDRITASGTDVYNYLSKDHVVVARFTADNSNDTAASFQASIQMGDGTPSIVGEVYGGNGEFYVVLPDWSAQPHNYVYSNFVLNGQAWTTFLARGYSYGHGNGYGSWDSYGFISGYSYWNSKNLAYRDYNWFDYLKRSGYEHIDIDGYGHANKSAMVPGDRDIIVTIQDAGSVLATVKSKLKINEATVGAPYYPVFVPSVGIASSAHNTRYLIIDWGDGTSTTSVPHIYTREGVYAVAYRVQVYTPVEGWRDYGTETQQVLVTDAPLTPLFTKSQPINGVAGEEFEDVSLFSFYDNDPNGSVEDFTAKISWGDGTTSEGTIEKSDRGTFDVYGTHIYKAGGHFTIAVLVEDAGGGSNTHGVRQVDISFNAEGKDFGGYANVATGQVILATIDGGEGEVRANPTATVDWGDGETSTATVVYNDEDDEYQVVGNHTYEDLGAYVILVTISEGGVTTTVDAKATIADDWSISGGQRTNQPGVAQLVTLGQAAVALNTGGLRIVQGLDFDLSPGTDVGGNPALVYNSDTVNVRPVIQAEFKSSEDDPVPGSIKVQLTFNGVVQDWITYATTDREPGDTYLLSAQVEEAVAQSGIYAWSLHVVLDFGGDQPDYHAELKGNARVVVNDSPAVDPDHPFESIDFLGAGWGIAGLDRLVLNANAEGDILWVTGSGDSAIFTRNDDGTFTSPAFDFGTLKRNDDRSYTYTSKYQTKHEFDRLGLMTALVDRNGVEITYSYTDEGQLETVTSPDGGVTTFTYNTDTLLLEKIEEPWSLEEGGEEPIAPRVLTFTHTNGNLTLIDELDGSERILTYDSESRLIEDRWAGLNLDGSGVFDAFYTYDAHSGLLTQVDVGLDSVYQITAMAMLGLDAQYEAGGGIALDASQAGATIEDNLLEPTTTTYFLDFEGRVLKEIGPDESTQIWVRDSHGQTTRYTNGRDHTTTYIYDYSKKGAGDLKKIVNPDKTTEQFQYDPKFHRVTLEVDARGNRTKYQYDQETGDLLSVTDPLYNVTRYTWEDGLLQTVTSPRNNVTSYTYDELRRVATVTDALGGATTFTYDGNGNVLTTEDAAHRVVTTTYDALGRLVEQVNFDGGITTWKYNVLGEVVEVVDPAGTTVSTYDPRGFLESVTLAAGTNAAQATFYQYDAIGRMNQATNYRGKITLVEYDDLARTKTVTNPLGGRTKTVYDANGNVISVTDANEHLTSYEYDKMDRLAKETNPLLGETTTEYDASGNVTHTIDPLGHQNHYAYDFANQLIQSVDAMGQSTFYAYDADGNLEEVIDPLHHTTTYSYDALNRLTLIIEPMGTTTSTEYNAAGDVSLKVDANGGETTYTYGYVDGTVAIVSPTGAITAEYYDQAGRLVMLVDPRGNSTSYAYDALGRQTSWTDGLDHIWTTRYVANTGQDLKIVTDPLLRSTTYAYDDLGRLVAVSDALGNTTATSYDAVGNVASTRTARGFTTNYRYDANDRLETVTDPLSNTTKYSYDAVGNITQSIDALNRVTVYEYDSNNRLIKTTDPLLATWETVYDPNGNVIREYDPYLNFTSYAYDANDRLIAATDPLNRTTTYGYDDNGNLIRETDPLSRSTTYAYDGENRLLATTDPLGFTSSVTYDAAGNVRVAIDKMSKATVYEYDENNRKISVTDSLLQSTTYHYDAIGNLTRTISPLSFVTLYGYDEANRLTGVTDSAGHTTLYQLDANGNVIQAIDSEGNSSASTYDALDRSLTFARPGGIPEMTSYDAVGNIILSTDSAGAATAYGYDANNRQTTITTPDMQTTTIAYDANGRVIGFTDPNGNVSTFWYDAVGRKTETIDPLGYSTTYGYDLADRLTSQLDRNGRLAVFGYDLADRQTSMTWYDAEGELGDQITRTYDAVGRLLTATNHAGTVSFGYDFVGRITGQTDVLDLTTTYGYDEENRLVLFQDELGGTTASQYDENGRLKNRTLTTADSTTARVDLARDSRGLATTVTYSEDAGGLAPVITRNAAFDTQGRIQSIAYHLANRLSAPGGTTLIESLAYSYDVSGRLASQTRLASSVEDDGVLLSPGETNNSYSSIQGTIYTSSGQLRSVTTTTLGVSHTTVYDYDFNGNITQVTVDGLPTTLEPNEVGTSNQLLEDGTWSYAYDHEGNVVSRAGLDSDEVWSYTYDHDNRLIKAVRRDIALDHLLDEVTYTYDALGRLVDRLAVRYSYNAETPSEPPTPTVEETRYALDASGSVWADLSSSNELLARYLRGVEVDQVFAREDGEGNVQWYLTDRLGSIIDLVDSEGHVDQRYGYTTSGVATLESYGDTPSYANSYQFTGKYWDPVTGLQYNNARWYDPSTSRWMSQDPLGFAAGDPNLYRYVFNDPINLTDPSGTEGERVGQRKVLVQGMSKRHNRTLPAGPDRQGDNTRGIQLVLGVSMVTGGAAGIYLTAGFASVPFGLVLARGIDHIQAAIRGQETVVYQGIRGAGFSDSAGRIGDFVADMPDVAYGVAKGVVSGARLLARPGSGLILDGGKLVADAIEGGLKGLARTRAKP
ncbi:RHS repeat-associated core domain-containing protein [Singulisphaera sp. Ch08]|uniref:RHS repeat-associated core domain-containing protein n=1 Tax=Singulisphaera sp. Ch08 TaxID=3120278 RepID=A0AAU7CIH4_9BACT